MAVCPRPPRRRNSHGSPSKKRPTLGGVIGSNKYAGIERLRHSISVARGNATSSTSPTRNSSSSSINSVNSGSTNGSGGPAGSVNSSGGPLQGFCSPVAKASKLDQQGRHHYTSNIGGFSRAGGGGGPGILTSTTTATTTSTAKTAAGAGACMVRRHSSSNNLGGGWAGAHAPSHELAARPPLGSSCAGREEVDGRL